jgi:hypothetical protein
MSTVAGGKKKDMKGVQYVIEKIDGMPNADLVVKYKNGKKVGQKVISIDKLKGASNQSLSLNDKKQKKTRVVYVQTPAPQQVQQPVIVQRQAGFGDYLMQGFGFGLGMHAAGALFGDIGDAFDDDY